MRITTIAALAGMVAATAPLAAQTQPNRRVMLAMGSQGKYVPALCELKGGNFQTSSAGVYIKIAAEGGFTSASDGRTEVDAKKYVDILTKAKRVASDGIAANPQNAAAWYYLGRSDLMLGDIMGADSALTHLEKMSPDCAVEIKGFRQKAWTVLINPGTEFLQNKQYDSALAVLRDANTVARYYPQGYYNLAATFANMTPSQLDSAIYYFKLAADKAGSDTAFAGTLKGSIKNTAYIYQQQGDNASAVIYFKKYLALDATSDDVKRALAATLRLTGNTAEAVQIENQLLAAGTLTNNEIAGVAVRMFNDKDYNRAAEAFKRILVTDPYNHDALNNLANTYLALNDGKNLLDASQKLLAVDPLGNNNLRLLANGYRLAADTNKWLGIVTQLQAMTMDVRVDSFTLRQDGARFVGTATGSEGRDAKEKLIPPAPTTLVFEFHNAAGEVVATQEVTVPALAPNVKQPIVVDATGAGILSWKYRKK